MNDSLQNLITLSISIGSIVFLIQQTDFIYEYISLFSRLTRGKLIDKILKFEYYEKNSDRFENYVFFLGSVFGVKKNPIGFICRLLTCFICLNCFLSVFCSILFFKSVIYVFPCFLLAMIVFYILFNIKKAIFS